MNSASPHLGNSSKSRSRMMGLWALGLLVLGAFVIVFRKGALPLAPPKEVLAHLQFGWLVLAVLAFHVCMVAKYARVYFLVLPFAHVPLGRIVNIGALSSALVTLLPFRLGELSRPALLREKGKLSALHLTSTVAVERIVDGVAFGGTLLGGLGLARPVEPLPDKIGNLPVPVNLVPAAAQWLTAGFALALVVMVVAYVLRSWVVGWIERILAPRAPRIAERAARSVTLLVDGIGFLRVARLSIPYLGLTVIHIVTHVFAILWLGWAVGIGQLTFIQSATLVGCLAIGFAFPNAPGFFGAVQLSLYAGLGLYLSPELVLREGAALTAIFYLIFLVSILGAAVIAALLEYGPRGFIRGSRVTVPAPETSADR